MLNEAGRKAMISEVQSLLDIAEIRIELIVQEGQIKSEIGKLQSLCGETRHRFTFQKDSASSRCEFCGKEKTYKDE